MIFPEVVNTDSESLNGLFKTGERFSGAPQGASVLSRRETQRSSPKSARTIRRKVNGQSVSHQSRIHIVVCGVERWSNVEVALTTLPNSPMAEVDSPVPGLLKNSRDR